MLMLYVKAWKLAGNLWAAAPEELTLVLSKLIPDLHRMLVTCSHKIYEVQEWCECLAIYWRLAVNSTNTCWRFFFFIFLFSFAYCTILSPRYKLPFNSFCPISFHLSFGRVWKVKPPWPLCYFADSCELTRPGLRKRRKRQDATCAHCRYAQCHAVPQKLQVSTDSLKCSSQWTRSEFLTWFARIMAVVKSAPFLKGLKYQKKRDRGWLCDV